MASYNVPISQLFLLFFFPDAPSFFLKYFPLYLKKLISKSLSVALWVTISFGLPSSESIFISPSFLKLILTRYKIFSGLFFSIGTWKMLW